MKDMRAPRLLSLALVTTLTVALNAGTVSSFAAQSGAQAVLDAKLGPCSADFVVTDAEAKPVYNALIHVRVRYGAFSVKRMDLEVGTDSEGKARIQGLPERARPLMYDVRKDGKMATAQQDIATTCKATFALTLK